MCFQRNQSDKIKKFQRIFWMHRGSLDVPTGFNLLPKTSSYYNCYDFLSLIMRSVCNSLKRTKSEAIAELISAKPYHIVLETSTPDYMKKISQYLESSVEGRRQNKACDEPANVESDSGDSLFITQVPVPEPVRTQTRHRCDPSSPRDLEEDEDDTSSSASLNKSTAEKKKKIKFIPQKYTFPFLKKKWKHRSTFLPLWKNKSLNNAVIGGFFKCVREVWQGYESGNMGLSLHTVDMDGEYISPLSEEEEEERPEEEDMRVVKNRCFLAPSKAKCSLPWYTPAKTDDQLNQQRNRRKVSNTNQDMAKESQRKMPFKISAKASVTRATVLSSDTDSCDGGGPCRALVERKTDDEHERSNTSFLRQTPKTKRRLTRSNKKIQEKEREELSNDSDATVCEPLQPQRNLSKQTGVREAAINTTEAQADVVRTVALARSEQEEEENGSQSLLQSLPQFLGDTNNSACYESTVKKKKNKKAKGDYGRIEEGRGQSQEEPEGLHAAASVNFDPEETFSWLENSRAKPLTLQTCDELELSENYIENYPHSAPMKRKRKKRMSTAENVREGMGDNLESCVTEDSMFSVMCNIENADQVKKKKKKKKKLSVEDDECVEQLQSTAVAETLNDDADTLEKMKKEKSITGEHREENLENNECSLETLGSNYEKKRRKHKKNKLSSSLDDTQIGEEDVAKVSLSNGGVTFEGNTGLSVKKRKTKKRRESISEGVDMSYAPGKSKRVDYIDNSQTTIGGSEDRDAVHVTKKKRKKIDDISKREVPEDTVAQSGDVWKKENNRTSSFLEADSEEQDAQTLQQQHSCLTSVAAGVKKVFGHVDAKSAEITGNSGNVVSKKKKKRKRKTSATQDCGRSWARL